MKVWTGTKPNIEGHVRCGETYFTLRNSTAKSTPFVNHIAIGIEDYDVKMVVAELKRRGLPAVLSPDGNPQTTDPEGYTVQITGRDSQTTN